MKTLFSTFMLITALILGTVAPTFSQNSEQLFQKGMIKEEGDGALQEAINLYKQVVDQDNADRALKAKALLQIGICYQKLGKLEAKTAFQKLIQEYGEQTDVVSEAKRLLTQMKSASPDENLLLDLFMQRVWQDAGAGAAGGSLSSNGDFLSHTDEVTGNLAYREIANGRTVLLTEDGTWTPPMQFNVVSIISPDDKQIAYGWYNSDGIHEVRLINIANPQPQVIYNNKEMYSFPGPWSPDGRKLIVFGMSLDQRQQMIQLLNIASGESLNLPIKELTPQANIAFSNDGNHIVYDTPIEENKGKQDIMIISADGQFESVLIEHPANDRLLGWIPNSNDVLFLSDRSGTWDAWTIEVINGLPNGQPQRVVPEIGEISYIDFTDDGSFYFSRDSQKNTALIAPLTKDPIKINMDFAETLLGSNYSMEFSPSGNKSIYTKEVYHPNNQGGRLNQLHIWSSETKKEEELLVLMAVRHPVWSPDEKSLYAIGLNGSKTQLDKNNGGIYKIDVETGGFEEILFFPKLTTNDEYAIWYQSRVVCSKDNTKIYYLYDKQVIERDLGSGKERVLMQDDNFARFLDLSPDGKELLFGTFENDSENVSLRSFELYGEGQKNLIYSGKKGDYIDIAKWSFDGKGVFFNISYDRGGKGSSIFYVKKDGESRQQLWKSENQNSGLSINPAGGQIAFSTFKRETECWMMSNYRRDK